MATFTYQFWRPVTAIVSGDVDGNHLTESDPAWLPLVTTPAFPGYPSAQASASYAARLVAESLFGPWHARFDLSHPDHVQSLITEHVTVSRQSSTLEQR